MNDGSDLFRRVRRGYDPAEVHHRLLELTAAATRAEGRVLELSRRLRDLEEASTEALQRAKADDSSPASFDLLGDRIGKMLALAEEEAAAIRAAAIADAESLQRSAEEAAERCTDEADTYAEKRRGAAEAEAAGIIQRAAERRQEVEAAYEAQRAEAAQAAADLEVMLAKRRETSEQQLAAHEARLSQVSSEADRVRSDAEEQARRLVEGGQRRAQQAVARVMADAQRMRVESERELAATIERKKSIDAQLTKDLKLMLSTLSASDATTIETEKYDLDDNQASGDGSDGDESVLLTRPFVNETVSGADTATAQPAGNGLQDKEVPNVSFSRRPSHATPTPSVAAGRDSVLVARALDRLRARSSVPAPDTQPGSVQSRTAIGYWRTMKSSQVIPVRDFWVKLSPAQGLRVAEAC